MAASFVVVPQWQGSGSSRAMRLVDGADAIRGDLPASSTRVVEVPLEAGDDQGTGVHRLSSIALVRDRLVDALRESAGPVITIGGDCGVELGAIGHVLTERPDVAVLWLDAHPDLNTPESSTSHAFTGMVLRTLLGDGPAQLLPPVALPSNRVVLAGVRSTDPGEEVYLETHGIRAIDSSDVTAESLIEAIESTGATAVYVHVDLDVIDPSQFAGIGYPEPFGVDSTTLVDALKAVLARFEFAGAGVTEFAPTTTETAVEDLPTILRIVGAFAAAS
jgi:arginase